MLFTLFLPDTTQIDILAVYAPSQSLSEFWEEERTLLNTGKNTHMRLGDYNCTLDHQKNNTRYKTDPHKKSRKVINI